MGRTHSNGYRRVPNFFPDLVYTPILKAVCFRNEIKAKAFADNGDMKVLKLIGEK